MCIGLFAVQFVTTSRFVRLESFFSLGGPWRWSAEEAVSRSVGCVAAFRALRQSVRLRIACPQTTKIVLVVRPFIGIGYRVRIRPRASLLKRMCQEGCRDGHNCNRLHD